MSLTLDSGERIAPTLSIGRGLFLSALRRTRRRRQANLYLLLRPRPLNPLLARLSFAFGRSFSNASHGKVGDHARNRFRLRAKEVDGLCDRAEPVAVGELLSDPH
jgi:hypothetical protein